ncbi:MAG: tetratricopeptide repeat protein [Pirellulaceae bacterium]
MNRRLTNRRLQKSEVPRKRQVLANFLAKWLCVGLLMTSHPTPGLAQLLEDPLEILARETTLSESQRDHAEAVTQYTHGRALLQRGSQAEGEERLAIFGQSLRCMQRAWWFDHDLVPIMEDIFPLAMALDRSGEATRYAILAAEQQTVPAELQQRVASVLAEQDEFTRALDLYRKIAASHDGPLDALTQFEIGRLSLLVGKYEEGAVALALARDALERRGEASLSEEDRTRLLRNPEVTYALVGEGFLHAKRLDEAEAMFRRADESKPNPATLGLRLARVEYERGDREQALQQLDHYFSAKTTSAGMVPYQLLALLIDGPLPAGAADDASEKPPSPALLERLRALAANDPHNLFLGYYLADWLRTAELWEEAESQYRQMLALESAADGHQGLVEIYLHRQQLVPLLNQLGEVVGQTGSLAPLEASTQPLVQDPALLEQLSAAALAQRTDPEHPPAPGAWMALALLTAKAGNFERAETFYGEALKKPGPAAGHFAVNYGLLLLEADQAARAAAVFQHVLDEKLLPDRAADLYFYMTGAWTLAKDFDQALSAAQELAKLEPNSARMLAREPWVLYQAKRLDEAERGYRRLLERFDANHESDENRAAVRDIRFALSAIHVEQNRMAEAEERLQQVLDEFPEDIGAFNDLGYLWCDQGQHLERALTMLQRAVQAEPRNIAYRDSLGWVLYRLGRYAEALAELQIAAATDNADGVILEHAGDAYLKMNQMPAALDSWQKAAAAFQRQEDLQRLQQVQDKIKQHSPR